MSEDISKEDQDWLDTLAGKQPQNVDPLIAAEALAVRKALASRRDEIEANTARVGNIGLDEIRARLQREGLLVPSAKAELKQNVWDRIKNLVGFGSAQRFPIWGLAATLALAILLTMQMPRHEPDEATVFRGDPNATTLIVENPEARANEIIAGIKAISPNAVQMTRLSDGRIQLLITDTQSIQDYLLAQRIEAIAADGTIKIHVVPKKK